MTKLYARLWVIVRELPDAPIDHAVREADQLLGRYGRIEDADAISNSQIEAGETALASAQMVLRQSARPPNSVAPGYEKPC